MFVVVLASMAVSALAASTAETIAAAGLVTCGTIATGAAAYNLTRDGGSSINSSNHNKTHSNSDEMNHVIETTSYTIEEEDDVIIVNWI